MPFKPLNRNMVYLLYKSIQLKTSSFTFKKQTNSHEIFIIYHRSYLNHWMGIRRIRIFCRWFNPHLISYRYHFLNFRIPEKRYCSLSRKQNLK